MAKKSFFAGKLCIAPVLGLLLGGCEMGPYIDTTPPALVSAVVRDAAPDQLVLTFNEAALADSAAGWSLTEATVSGKPSGIGTRTWTFYLAADVSPGQTLRVSYDASVGSTRDSAGNLLEDIFAHAVTNTVGQPETGGESSNPFVGTWTGDDGTVTITGSTWEMTGDVKGTYTRNGNRATLATTHYWSYYGWEPITGIPQYTATVSGNTLTVLYDGETLRFTRETGGGSANPFVGTWTGDGGALTIANSTWELAEDVKGTYTRRGNGATLATTHYWSLNRWVSITGEPLHTANVSGTTLVVNYYDETLMFTKKSGVSGSF